MHTIDATGIDQTHAEADGPPHDTHEPLSRPFWLLALTLIVTADALFFRAPLGWCLGVFAAGVLALVLVQVRGGAVTYVLAGASLLGSTSLVVETSVVGLVLSGLPLLLLAAARGVDAWPAPDVWVDRAVTVLARAPLELVRDVRTALDRGAGGTSGAGRTNGTSEPSRFSLLGRAGLVWGWGLPVAIVGVFALLLRDANPVIEGWMRDAAERLVSLARALAELPEPARVGFWLATAVGLWALLRSLPSRVNRLSSLVRWALDQAPEAELLPTVVLLRTLALLNALFAVENGLDIDFLWGGGTLPPGMSYASYAHRGAYPLIATAILAAALVLVTFRPGGLAGRSLLARVLVHAWIAQNVVLTASALWRLRSYIAVYGLTRLRFAAAAWMLLVAVGLAAIFARIALGRSNGWLLRVNFVALVVVLYCAAFTDVDGRIAWNNARLAVASGSRGPEVSGATGVGVADLAYLERLGTSALPALAWLTHAAEPPALRQEAAARAGRLQAALDEELEDWRAWTVRRASVASETSDRAFVPARARGGVR